MPAKTPSPSKAATRPTSPARSYPPAPGGLPPQSAFAAGRAVFTDSYAVIPHSVMRDITTSFLPGWDGTRLWVLARPMTGFSETFSHYLCALAPGGGSTAPEPDQNAQAVLFVTSGELRLTINGTAHDLGSGGYAYIPSGADWTAHTSSERDAVFHWVRKHYAAVEGIDRPDALVASDAATPPIPMPDCDAVWSTTRFVDPDDLRYDMHVNIVTFKPGGTIPFAETHVMEHGLFVLQGEADYLLNRDWVPVKAGDFMWLRAFCPQACRATGDEPFRYLLYKDVNRHMPLSPGGLMRAAR